MRNRCTVALLALLALVGVTGCGQGETRGEGSPMGDVTLGPTDGRDLPPVDLDRVQDGSPAPDFSLESYAGPVVTLSDFRGEKNVVLVFYRGHW